MGGWTNANTRRDWQEPPAPPLRAGLAGAGLRSLPNYRCLPACAASTRGLVSSLRAFAAAQLRARCGDVGRLQRQASHARGSLIHLAALDGCPLSPGGK